MWVPLTYWRGDLQAQSGSKRVKQRRRKADQTVLIRGQGCGRRRLRPTRNPLNLGGEHLHHCPTVQQGSLSMHPRTSVGKGCSWGINSLALWPTPWEFDMLPWAEKALQISSKAAWEMKPHTHVRELSMGSPGGFPSSPRAWVRHRQRLLQGHRNMWGCEGWVSKVTKISTEVLSPQGLEGGRFSRWTSRGDTMHEGLEMRLSTLMGYLGTDESGRCWETRGQVRLETCDSVTSFQGQGENTPQHNWILSGLATWPGCRL